MLDHVSHHFDARPIDHPVGPVNHAVIERAIGATSDVAVPLGVLHHSVSCLCEFPAARITGWILPRATTCKEASADLVVWDRSVAKLLHAMKQLVCSKCDDKPIPCGYNHCRVHRHDLIDQPAFLIFRMIAGRCRNKKKVWGRGLQIADVDVIDTVELLKLLGSRAPQFAIIQT